MKVNQGALASGLFFILAGVAFLLDALGVWELRARQLWPLLLIGLGLAVVIGAFGGRDASGR